MTIIDVSEWQGVIDWNKVKPQIDGAILRCGCGTSYNDKQWTRNVAECERLGIPFGVYLYSYAKTAAAAKKEAEHVLRMIAGHKLALPVYFDAEESGTEQYAHTTAGAFCAAVEAAGYPVGIYSTAGWFNNYIGLPQYTRWVASWGTNNGQPQRKPTVASMDMWQYTSVGKFNGINGNVDVSLCYLKFNESEDINMTEKEIIELIDQRIAAKLVGADTKPSEWIVKTGELEKAKKLGITDGTRPGGYATREEVAAMVQRDHEKIEGGIAVMVTAAVAAVVEKLRAVLVKEE